MESDIIISFLVWNSNFTSNQKWLFFFIGRDMIESIVTTFNISGGDSIVNPACAFYQVWYFYYYFIIYFSYGVLIS